MRAVLSYIEERVASRNLEEEVEWFKRRQRAAEMVPALKDLLVREEAWLYRVTGCTACYSHCKFHIPSLRRKEEPSLFASLCNCHQSNLIVLGWEEVAMFFLNHPGLLDLYTAFQMDAVDVEEANV